MVVEVWAHECYAVLAFFFYGVVVRKVLKVFRAFSAIGLNGVFVEYINNIFKF